MTALPSTLSLENVADGAEITASPHRNNYSAIQTQANALLGILDDGTAGQVFQSSGGSTVGWATPAIVQLYDNTAGGNISSWDVSSGLTGYNHLKLIVQARGSTAATSTALALYFNNDTAANYDSQSISGATATASAAQALAGTTIRLGDIPAANSPASSAGNAEIVVANYAGTTFHKQLQAVCGMRYDTTLTQTETRFGNWRSTAAITRITIIPAAGSFIAGSRLTIYGLL